MALRADPNPNAAVLQPDPTSAWREAIRSRLDARRRAVFAQIAAYPSPIAGCDQQFNHLLVQRDALTAELNALDALDRAGMEVLNEFLAASRCLDEDARSELLANRPR